VTIRVELSKEVVRQLRRVPKHVVTKLFAWVDDVETRGLEEVRKVPGYNDHPLKGSLEGKRAIRLNKQWRAVYVASAEGAVEFVLVEEVHPHDY
jgi:proteic killer suppression protein